MGRKDANSPMKDQFYSPTKRWLDNGGREPYHQRNPNNYRGYSMGRGLDSPNKGILNGVLNLNGSHEFVGSKTEKYNPKLILSNQPFFSPSKGNQKTPQNIKKLGN